MKLPTFENPLKLFTPAQPAFAGAGTGVTPGNMMFSSGSGRGSGSGPDDDDYGIDEDYAYEDDHLSGDDAETQARPKSNRTRRSTTSRSTDQNGGRGRTASYQPEERYWTDYLRIALPVIGIILLVGLLWLWASNLLDNDTPVGDPTPEDTIGLVSTETVDPNEVNTEPNQIGTPGPTQPAGQTGEIPISGQPTPAPTTGAAQAPATAPAEGDTDADAPADDADDAASGELTDGAAVRITEGNVNIRTSAGTSADIVRTSEQDEEGVILSGPEEADGLIWWQVVFDGPGDTGWVAEDFLEVLP